MSRISNEEINALPIRRYEGPIVLVASAGDVERALADFAAERLVGFDTETRPTFKVGQKHSVALAQVATSKAVLNASIPLWKNTRLGETRLTDWQAMEQFMRAAGFISTDVDVTKAFTNDTLN